MNPLELILSLLQGSGAQPANAAPAEEPLPPPPPPFAKSQAKFEPVPLPSVQTTPSEQQVGSQGAIVPFPRLRPETPEALPANSQPTSDIAPAPSPIASSTSFQLPLAGPRTAEVSAAPEMFGRSLSAGLASLRNSPFKGEAFANSMGAAMQGGERYEDSQATRLPEGLPRKPDGSVDYAALSRIAAKKGMPLNTLLSIENMGAEERAGQQFQQNFLKAFGGGTAAAAQPGATSATEPRGIRNNNPLNLEASPFTQKMPGFVGSDGRFGKFATLDDGLKAADKLLENYGNMGVTTLGGVISKWAPASDGNPVASYVDAVAKKSGLDPNSPINLRDPAVRAKILPAMAEFENGKPVANGAPARAPAGAPESPPVASGAPAPTSAPESPTIMGAPTGKLAQFAMMTLADPRSPSGAKELAKVLLTASVKPDELPSSVKEYNFYAKQKAAAREKPDSFEDWQDKQNKGKQANTIVNNVTNPVFEGMGKRFNKSQEQADAAVQDIRAIHEARGEIDKGIISGTGAEQRLNVAKIGSLLGIPDDKIASTETFKVAVGQRVLSLVKGLGSGSGISNADREYAEKMAGGQIGLDEKSIRRILDIGEKAARGRITQHNALAKKMVGTQEELKPYSSVMTIDEPPPYAAPATQPSAAQPATAPVTTSPQLNDIETEMRKRGLLQ